MCAFAANSIFCRLALAHTRMDPAAFTLVRMASGALVLSVLAYLAGARQVHGSWQAAILLLAYAVCFSFAYVWLTVGTGALLLFGAVQVTMIARGLVGGERLGAAQWVGLVVAITGLFALLAPGVSAPSPAGALLMTAAGVAWGGYSLLGRAGRDALATTAGNFVRSLPLALPLLALAQAWDAEGMLWAALSGAVASGVGYAIWYAALPGLSAARAASIQLSVPVIAALSGVALLGEPLSLRLLIASAAVLGGVGLVMWGRARSAASQED